MSVHSEPPVRDAAFRGAGAAGDLDARLADPPAQSVAVATARVLEARAQIARWQAVEIAALADAGRIALAMPEGPSVGRGARQDMALRSVAAHIGAAAHSSDRAVERRIGDAMLVTERFPITFASLRAGRVSPQHVAMIIELGTNIEGDAARAVFDARAARLSESEAPGRVRARLKRLGEQLQPRSLDARHRIAREARAVWVRPLEDGMSQLVAELPSVLATGIYDRLTRQARAMRVDRTRRERADDGVAGPVAAGADGSRRADVPSGADAVGVDAPGADGVGTGGAGTETAGTETADTDTAVTDASGADGSEEVDASGTDPRTMDQLRADLFADMLLTAAPVADARDGGLSAIRALVQVTIPVDTLVGSQDAPRVKAQAGAPAAAESRTAESSAPPAEGCPPAVGVPIPGPPAELAGGGPIDAASARALIVNEPGWDRIYQAADSGRILSVDRYRRSAQMQRFLQARDIHCRFPGCRMPAHRSDLDHTVDAALGGATATDNLAFLCKRHHALKQAAPAWRVAQRAGGILEWTSPFGATYVDLPPGMVRFDDPPF